MGGIPGSEQQISSVRYVVEEIYEESESMNVVLKYSMTWPYPDALPKEDRDKIKCIASVSQDDAPL